MSKFALFLTLVALMSGFVLWPRASYASPSGLDQTEKSVLVINQDTNEILVDDNGEQLRYLASTAKLPWVYAFLKVLQEKKLDLESTRFPVNAVDVDPDDPLFEEVTKKLDGYKTGTPHFSATELIKATLGKSSNSSLSPIKKFIGLHGDTLDLRTDSKEAADYVQTLIDGMFEENNSTISIYGSTKAKGNGQDNMGSLKDILWVYRMLDPSYTDRFDNQPIVKAGLKLAWDSMEAEPYPNLEPKGTWTQMGKSRRVPTSATGKVGYWDDLEADWPEGLQNVHGWQTKYSTHLIWVGKLSVRVDGQLRDYWYAYAYHAPHNAKIGADLLKSWGKERQARVKEFFLAQIGLK